ncbi:Carboxy-terminal processing protease CtpB [bacterium HR37]|nr:Carboxy-terminal processing protease CtpB [bacterium HR37]
MKRILRITRYTNILFIIALAYLFVFSSTFEGFRGETKKANLSILPLVTQYVKRYYVDHSAIHPRLMVVKGLEKLERSLDEVLVDFPEGERSQYFTVQVGNEKKRFDMRKVENITSAADTVEEVFGFIIPRVSLDGKKISDIEYAVVDEMLKTLDPHSGIIPPQVYREFMIETEGSFGGLGIVIGIRDGQLTVIAPIEGTPAYRAGIKPNDRIVQIEDESTINMSLIEAVSKLRGPKGTTVNIYIMREGFSEPKRFSIVRDIIKIESVEAFNLGDGVGYIRIRDFQKNTLSSLEEELNRLKREGNLKGIVLDLRGNPGGLLDQAEKISDLFLSNGVIVTTKVGNSKKRYRAREEERDFKGRIIVLVDSGSASASEIVAGALKNNQRALVMGEKTFGKGSVQQIFDLTNNSALKLTIASYLTPGDISIQDVGITPDIAVHPAIVSKEEIKLIPSFEENKDTKKPLYSITYLETNKNTGEDEEQTPEEALSREERRKKLEGDFYVKTAKELILSSHSISRNEMLKEVKEKLEEISRNEERKIEERMKALGVDWSLEGDLASSSPSLSVKVSPSPLRVKAGEKVSLSVEVKNTGQTPLFRLMAVAKSDNPVFNGKEFVFGRVNPGEKRSWSVTLEVPKWALTREDMVTLEFKDAFNSNIPDFAFDIRTEGLSRPLFAFNYAVIDDGSFGSSGNGDGIPEVGETIALLVRVKNTGKGVSEKSILTIKNLSGDKVFLKKGRAEFSSLKPGEVKDATLLFSLKKPDSKIDMEVQILDEVFRDGITTKVSLPEEEKEEEFVKRVFRAVVLRDGTPIRGGSFSEAPVLAVSQKGAVFRAVGENTNWVKVELGKDLYGWIQKAELRLEGQNLFSPLNDSKFTEVFEEAPFIEITPPPLTTSSREVELKGTIRDKDGVRLVSVFVGDNKVELLPAKEKTLPVSFRVELNEGVNVITVFAKDSKGLFVKESFVVRRGTGEET